MLYDVKPVFVSFITLLIYANSDIWTVYIIYTHTYFSLNSIIYSSDKKDKAIPLQAWTGPEGSRRLRLPYFKTVGT